MGRCRHAFLALAVTSLLALNGAAAASRGTPRPSSRRPSSKSGSRSNRNQRYPEEEADSREHVAMGMRERRSEGRARSKRGDQASLTSSPRKSSRASASTSRSRSRYSENRSRRSASKGMELVPSRRTPPKNNMFAGLAATMKGKAGSLREDARGKMTEWKNIAKTTVWFSSKMEKFMIQMTWPDDGLLDDVWVQDTMNFLESAGNEPPRSPNNPNKRILRKLWLRMTEEDYRTKLKALQILHHAAMDLSPEAHIRVRNQFMKMRDETNHKNRNEVYFEPSRVVDVSSSGMPFLPLLRSYSSFTFRRIMDVPGGPKQVASTLRSKRTSHADAVTLLRRLDKLICLGTGCKVDRKMLNTITGQVVQLTARDMMSLWRLYVKGLTRLIKGGYKGEKEAAPEVVASLLRQYMNTQQLLQTYLSHFKRVVRDRSIFHDNQVDDAALKDYLASVDPPEQATADVEEECQVEAEVEEEEA